MTDFAERGGRLVNAFAGTRWGPAAAAFWRRSDGFEDGVWRLYVVPTSGGEADVLDIYQDIDRLETDMAEPRLPRFTADVALPSEPLAAAALTHPLPGPQPRWVDPESWGVSGEADVLVYPAGGLNGS